MVIEEIGSTSKPNIKSAVRNLMTQATNVKATEGLLLEMLIMLQSLQINKFYHFGWIRLL